MSYEHCICPVDLAIVMTADKKIDSVIIFYSNKILSSSIKKKKLCSVLVSDKLSDALMRNSCWTSRIVCHDLISVVSEASHILLMRVCFRSEHPLRERRDVVSGVKE